MSIENIIRTIVREELQAALGQPALYLVWVAAWLTTICQPTPGVFSGQHTVNASH